MIPSRNGAPHAFHTLLGWCIVGPVGVSRDDVSVACNRVAVEDLSCRAITPHYFAVETEVKDTAIQQMLHKMSSADFTEQGSPALEESNCEMSVEDRRFMEIMYRECV